MSEMVERVAKSMAEEAGFAWEACTQDQWRRDARAGIAALRFPTNAMIEAACATILRENKGLEYAPFLVWQAMIAEALR